MKKNLVFALLILTQIVNAQCPTPVVKVQTNSGQTFLSATCTSPYVPVWYHVANLNQLYSSGNSAIQIPVTSTVSSYFVGCWSETCIGKLINAKNATITEDACPSAKFAYSSSTYPKNTTFVSKPKIEIGSIAQKFTISPTNTNIKINSNTGEITLSAVVIGTFKVTNTIDMGKCQSIYSQDITFKSCNLPKLKPNIPLPSPICAGTNGQGIMFSGLLSGVSCGVIKVTDTFGALVNITSTENLFSPGILNETTTLRFSCSNNGCSYTEVTWAVIPKIEFGKTEMTCEAGMVNTKLLLKTSSTIGGKNYQYRIIDSKKNIVLDWAKLGTIPNSGLESVFQVPAFMPFAGSFSIEVRVEGTTCVASVGFDTSPCKTSTTDFQGQPGDVKLYPNPVIGSTFNLELPTGIWNISIIYSTGTVMRTWESVSNKMIVNVDGFRSGTYYVKLSNDKRSYAVTFVK